MTPEQIEMYKSMPSGSRVTFPDDPQTIIYPFIDKGKQRIVLNHGLKIKLTEDNYYILGSDENPIEIKYNSEEPVEEQANFIDIVQQLNDWLELPGVVKGIIDL